MAKKTKTKEFEIISIRKLTEKAHVEYFKTYHNIRGNYNSLTEQEKTQLSNELFDEVSKAFKWLGFRIEIKRVKD